MNRTTTILGMVLGLLLVLPVAGIAELPIERAEMFKRILTDREQENKEMKDHGLTLHQIFEETLDTRTYSVLEAALSSKNFNIQSDIIRLIPRMPDDARKRFILDALMNRKLWPTDEEIEKLKMASGPMPEHYLLQQAEFMLRIAENFGKEFRFPMRLWTSAQRAEQLEALRPAQYTASNPNPRNRSPSNLPPARKSTSDDRVGAENSGSGSELGGIGTDVRETPLLWMVWAGIGTGAVGIAGWLAVRLHKKKRYRR